MRAGELDRTIVIERSTGTISDSGAETLTWAPLVTLRAKLIEATGLDVLRNAGTLSETARIFQTHWFDGATLTDRVAYQGQLLRITSIREIGRRVALELHCETIQ